MMNSNAKPINCPIRGAYDFEPCDPAEVTPLVEFLNSNQSVASPVEFTRGTMLPDGRLDLCKQDLGPDGCFRVTEAIKSNCHVRSLLLGTDGIGDVGANSVADMLRENESLQIVYLGCNSISSEGTHALADSLRENQTVKGLWLKRNPIGDEGALAIAELLRSGSGLEVLDLVNTGIGKRGLASLLKAMESVHCQIRRLYLGGNGFDADDARMIANSLVKSKTIRSLMLGVNDFGDDGAAAMAELLTQCPALEELGLASNGIGERGTKVLCAAIEKHPTLAYFDFGFSPSTKVLGASGNSPGERGHHRILQMLAANPMLRRLNLRGTGFESGDRQELCGAMQSNTNLVALVVDGKLPESVKDQLLRNGDDTPARSEAPEEVKLIRSVYRTARKIS